MLSASIPYSEAWHIDEIKEPKFDTQKEVLDALEGLLDEALGQIDESDPNTTPNTTSTTEATWPNGANWPNPSS